MSLSDSDIERYSRNILVSAIGGHGQEKLLAARVLVIGAGGLGSPALYYMAAAGIGHLGICDDDCVEISNLQRQILHVHQHIGMKKALSAQAALRALNPAITLTPHVEKLTEANAEKLIDSYDIIVDGSDNYLTRLLVQKCCYRLQKTLISAAVKGFDGQLYCFKPHQGSSCYGCIYPEAPPDAANCSATGVLGAVTGVMGSLQAVEVVKEITGAGESLAGRMLLYDGLLAQFRKIRVPKDPACPVCAS